MTIVPQIAKLKYQISNKIPNNSVGLLLRQSARPASNHGSLVIITSFYELWRFSLDFLGSHMYMLLEVVCIQCKLGLGRNGYN